MLYEFVVMHRDAIITKARQKLTARPWPSASANELENGVPLFLTQLAEALRAEESGSPYQSGAISDGATRHGRDLRALGFTVSQVVHDYGDICQAVTELAIEQNAPITTEEFHTLNRCLDAAIAEAVTEHTRLTLATRATDEVARMGHLGHDVRAMVESAILAFEMVKTGAVAVNGSTGMVLGRNLLGLKVLLETALTDIQQEADNFGRQRVAVSSFLLDTSLAAHLRAGDLGLRFILEPIEPTWVIHVDPHLLRSAVTSLLDNAFKFTPADGLVLLRAHQADGRLLIEVEDGSGGIPGAGGDPLSQPSDDRPNNSRELSTARKAVRALGGHLTLRKMPGKGCIFIIEIATEPTESQPVPCRIRR
jgi:signal transduction histidine kinase